MIRLALLLTLATPAAAGPLAQAELSARLYAQGLALQDPVAILAAARLRKAAGFPPGGTLPVGWQVMLDSAATMAQGDETGKGVWRSGAGQAATRGAAKRRS